VDGMLKAVSLNQWKSWTHGVTGQILLVTNALSTDVSRHAIKFLNET